MQIFVLTIGSTIYKSNIIFSKRHWRTVSSSCLTFLTTKSTLTKAAKLLKLYPKLGDFGMWLTVTRMLTINQVNVMQKTYGRLTTIRMLFYSLRGLFSTKSFSLWSPIPSIATHMAEFCLAPGINWQEIIKQYSQDKISLSDHKI
jgi:hypothetical protein